MSSSERKTVLVIDDDITIRKLISHHLKLNNYNAILAEDAETGLKLLDENKIDIVLCDVMLGELDGFTFCEQVRENQNHRLIPFIFVTAKKSFQDKSRAMDVGGDDIITKPFDVDELMLKIRSLLKRSGIYKIYGAKKNLERSFAKKQAEIVLIDDDTSLTTLFKYNLEKEGFNCRIAHTAPEAIKLMSEITPDLIICDVMMPKIDGFEFRKLILNDPELKSIPFIFLTVKGEEKNILDGYDLDIADYILKTAGPKVIVAKVTALINSLGNERQKAVNEITAAADSLRVKVVPDTQPNSSGFAIDHWHLPYRGIPGGDFIDYFKINEDQLAIVLGDVMGKRWGAWYFAFAYAGYIRSSLRAVLESGENSSPKKILERVNKSVYRDSKISEVFATISIVVLNKKLKTASYSGAGDLPIIHKSKSDGSVKRIQSDGILLGFLEKGEFEDFTINLNSGDQLVMCTDGIIESRDDSHKAFGAIKLIDVITSSNDQTKLIDDIKSEFIAFTKNKFEDDISLITIKVN